MLLSLVLVMCAQSAEASAADASASHADDVDVEAPQEPSSSMSATPAASASPPPPSSLPTTATPTPVLAPAPAAPAPDAAGPDVAGAFWSVGGGAVFGSSVVATSALERRTLPWLWAFVSATGGGESNGVIAGVGLPRGDTTSDDSRTTLRLNVATGTRVQLVADDAFARPSVVLGVGASVSQTSTDGLATVTIDDVSTETTTTSTALTTGVDVFGGVVVDFSLLPWLALRFSTDVASIGFHIVDRSTTSTTDDEENTSTSHQQGLVGGVSLSPALSLQAFF